MSLNEYFDKIYCINLKHRTDKWEQCLEIFNKHNLNVTRLEGVDGKELLKEQLKKRISKGEIGCSMSHALIFKEIIKKGYTKTLILEDDIDFVDDLQKKFNDSFEYMPVWDMLYLGGSHLNKPTKVNEYFYKITRTYTTSSYAVNNVVARAVLAEVENFRKQVDVVVSDFQKKFNSYTYIPALAWQRPSKSDIHNRWVDYRRSMKKEL